VFYLWAVSGNSDGPGPATTYSYRAADNSTIIVKYVPAEPSSTRLLYSLCMSREHPRSSDTSSLVNDGSSA
jgi:hypothetical protein